MAKDQEEIADGERDEEETTENEKDDEEGESEGAADESGDSKKDDEDESEEDDDDESDSDDDDDKPLTRKEVSKVISDALRKEMNRRGASQRDSKNRVLPKQNGGYDPERVNRIERQQREIVRTEQKRQFGYANGLAPDEVDVVYRVVKNPRAKDLNDAVVKGALDGFRAEKRRKANVPSPNMRPREVREKEEKNMTPAEKQERFTEKRRSILEGKK